MKNKLFFFIGYQHLYNSDQSTGLSQLNVPSGLTDDRSVAGLTGAAETWAEERHSRKQHRADRNGIDECQAAKRSVHDSVSAGDWTVSIWRP